MPVHPVKSGKGFLLAEPSGIISPHRKKPGSKKQVAIQAWIINKAIEDKKGK